MRLRSCRVRVRTVGRWLGWWLGQVVDGSCYHNKQGVKDGCWQHMTNAESSHNRWVKVESSLHLVLHVGIVRSPNEYPDGNSVQIELFAQTGAQEAKIGAVQLLHIAKQHETRRARLSLCDVPASHPSRVPTSV